MKKTRLVLLFVFITSLGFAIDFEDSRETLRGVKAIYVLIEMSPELQDIVISKRMLQTDAELKLRLAGIKVSSEKECLGDVNCARLYLNINGGFIDENIFIFNISTEIGQGVFLIRDNKILAVAETWSVSTVGYSGSLKRQTFIKETCKNQVDQFINAYLSVNPK